jgi:hypothetical protein
MPKAFVIPAATVDPDVIRRISNKSEAAGSEVSRLGALLDVGNETRADLVALGDLLYNNGEMALAEELLSRNIVDQGDDIFLAYRRLFGTLGEREFQIHIDQFAAQFAVKLFNKMDLAVFKRSYESMPDEFSKSGNRAGIQLLHGHCQVEFTYFSQNCSLADVYRLDESIPDNEYIVLTNQTGFWRESSGC